MMLEVTEAPVGVGKRAKAISTVLRTPAQQAIAAIAQFQTDLAQAVTVIDAASLGPFDLGGSCDYDCFLGICIHTYDWTWPLDFTNVRTPLENEAANLSQAAGQFDAAFGPTRQWLITTLPAFSADFATQAEAILAINAQIGPGGQATPAQLAAVQAAFQQIIAGLGTGHDQMYSAIAAMGQFNGVVVASENALTSLGASLQANIDGWVQSSQNTFAGSMPCGGDDFDNQVNSAVSTLNSSFATMQGNFSLVALDGQAVATATEQCVGAMNNIQAQYQDVLGQVDTADSYPAGAIQNLHLDVAQSEWTALSQYAVQELQ
jgi:hypothetical protein